ncbi:MAG: hypothetical protein GY730_03210 [bacterium]|nr:hypothetical protein [bacterium]
MLAINRKFNFAAAHRCTNNLWSLEKNNNYYGYGGGDEPGHGHNFEVYFVFEGPIDNNTGMIMELASLKKVIQKQIISHYDHHYLNKDIAYFEKHVPATENIAHHMFYEADNIYSGANISAAACHVRESAEKEATCYSDGRIESHYWFSLHIPQIMSFLSIKIRFTFETTSFDEGLGIVIPDHIVQKSISELRERLYSFISAKDTLDVLFLIEYCWDKVSKELPLKRIKLVSDDYILESSGPGKYGVGIKDAFFAAHKLSSPNLSYEQNRLKYGPCHRFHGHEFRIECSVSIEAEQVDNKMIFNELSSKFKEFIKGWQYINLSDLSFFKQHPSTGEYLIQILYDEADKVFDESIYRLRLWETPNNKFTIRKKSSDKGSI